MTPDPHDTAPDNAEANRELVRRAFLAAPILCSPGAVQLSDFYAESFTFMGPSSELTALAAFTDIQVDLKDLIAEDDRVVARWAANGLHSAVFQGVPPSGKRINVTGITIMRIEQERIAQGWGNVFWPG